MAMPKHTSMTFDSEQHCVCRQAGAIAHLVQMLSSGDESGVTAAAVWALLQIATDSPADQKVALN